VKLRILGCGTSFGVPRVGNDWGLCDPMEPRNRRTRVSILVEHEGTFILVDTSPDLREQLLEAQVEDLAAVIWTHDHADHCHGIDDLRQIYHLRGAPIRGLARHETLSKLKQRFDYVFEGKGGYPPIVAGELLPDEFMVGSVRIRIVDQPHGAISSAGIRFDAGGKSISYSTDCNALTPAMHSLFEGSDVWVVDALRRKPHPSHPHLDLTLDWIRSTGVRRAVLTHMDNSMDYGRLLSELPDHVEPGFDGLEIAL
jgi:phosphoribosyl 1,2-cyclic phosphate phosphodiesterase